LTTLACLLFGTHDWAVGGRRAGRAPSAANLGFAVAEQPLEDIPSVSVEAMEPAVGQQLREVRRRLDEALTAGRADSAIFGAAGSYYHAYDLTAAAEACYRNAQLLKPDEVRWPYLLAVLYEQAGRFSEAADSLERVLALPEKYYPALIRMANVALALERVDRAAASLAAAEKHAPGDSAFLAAVGHLAMARGRPQEAVVAFTGALAARPEATRLHYSLAMAYRALGQSDEARTHAALAGGTGVRAQDPILDAVLSLREGESAFIDQGLRAFRAGDFASAVTAFQRAVDASGGRNTGALVNLSASESKLGRFDAALGHLDQAFVIAPNDPAVLFNRGSLLVHVGRPQDAEPLFRRLAETTPTDMAARILWARTLLALDRPSDALSVIEALTSVQPAQCGELRNLLMGAEARVDPGTVTRARAAVERLTALGCLP
jgi:tetratricopeptide (TPR) repeat protein